MRTVKISMTSNCLTASASRSCCICKTGRASSAYSAGLRSHQFRISKRGAQGRLDRRRLVGAHRFLGHAVGGFFFLSLKLCRSSYFTVRMIPRSIAFLALLSTSAAHRTQAETNANRLTYLDETDPFCVGRNFPKLTTPQWVGEPGVEAVVILAIDDMRDPQRWGPADDGRSEKFYIGRGRKSRSPRRRPDAPSGADGARRVLRQGLENLQAPRHRPQASDKARRTTPVHCGASARRRR
jgi:hypothetical protein